MTNIKKSIKNNKLILEIDLSEELSKRVKVLMAKYHKMTNKEKEVFKREVHISIDTMERENKK